MIPNFKTLIERIASNEGFRSKPYRCSNNVLTFGHGLTWLTEEESLVILSNRISDLHIRLGQNFDWYDNLPPEIKSVVVECTFQMGVNGFSKFKKAIACMKEKDWKGAADEMLDSKWAKSDSPNRAKRLADIVREHG